MPVVKLPNGKRIKFPDDMAPQVIEAIITREYLQTKRGQPSMGGPIPLIPQPAEEHVTGAARWMYEHPEEVGATIASFGPGGLLRTAGRAGIGALAGHATRQLREQVTGAPQAPQTMGEVLKGFAGAGLKQAGYEIAGEVPIRIMGKILSPAGHRVIQGAQEAKRLIERYMPKTRTGKKIPGLLPAEATEYYPLDLMQNIAEKSIQFVFCMSHLDYIDT